LNPVNTYFIYVQGHKILKFANFKYETGNSYVSRKNTQNNHDVKVNLGLPTIELKKIKNFSKFAKNHIGQKTYFNLFLL